MEQYDLIRANRELHEKVLEQNEELKSINENLETLVNKRTMELEMQNQALELSRAILEDLPIPIIGISSEMMIVLINRKAQSLSINNGKMELGKKLFNYFSDDVEERTAAVLTACTEDTLKGYRLEDSICDIDLIPLSGRFRGKGVVLALKAHMD